jgi:hypothetical protein
MAIEVISEAELRQMERRYKTLQRSLRDLPWLLQGTVVERTPPSDSSTAKTAFRWTRKVGGKTVNVSLSRHQALSFRRAIKANRKLEEALKAMRRLSQDALLASLPGPKRSTTINHPTNATE